MSEIRDVQINDCRENNHNLFYSNFIVHLRFEQESLCYVRCLRNNQTI